jgi:tripartite-type tricarboxylate transporter receptor subunit TctC
MRKMRILRRVVLVVFTVFLASILMPGIGIGQEKYPSKTITVVLGLAPGGATDLSIRALAKTAEKVLKQPVVVTNKPGAGTAISMHYVKNSLPDGYTLGVATTGGILGPHLKETPYDFFEDFTHLTQFSVLPGGVVVHSDSPYKTLRDLFEYAKKNPGKLKYASTEHASLSHMHAEQMAFLNGFKWVHVPFAGDTPASAALLGKHVDAMVLGVVSWGPFVKSGKFRLLAVQQETRFKEFPDAPTITECGYKSYTYAPLTANYGVLAPKGLPSDVKETLLSAFREAWKDPEFQGVLEKLSIMPTYREGEDWIRFLKAWDKESVSVMKEMGVKLYKE